MGPDAVSEADGTSIAPDGAVYVFGVREWSPEACAILSLVNGSSFEKLDDEVRLSRSAARNIITLRKGTDDVLGNDNDVRIESLTQLAGISQVKRAAFRWLRTYVADHSELACTFPPVDLQIVSVSDWHGQLDPTAVANVGNVGGAAVLSTYFKQERATNKNTLVLMAGDAFGATPPLASFFEERPAVLAANLMNFDADGVGNHNFDRGVEHFEQMARMTRHPYLSANLENIDDNVSCPDKPEGRCVEPFRIFDVGGVKVAVIGVTNDNAPTLVKEGNLGTIVVRDAATAAMEARQEAADMGATVFILLPHVGAAGLTPDQGAVGPIRDLASRVNGFDVILADHTNVQFQQEINGQLVVENKSSGLTYARTILSFDRDARRVVNRRTEFVVPLSDPPIIPDPAIVEMLAPFRTELAVIFDGTIGTSSGVFERGNNVERLREVPLGNLVTDAMRVRYQTKIAYTNGGGLRSALPSSYAPQNTTLRRPAAGFQAGPPYDVVIGDVYSVLPFGNVVATREVTGEQLWGMMEHSVEALPTANGWFGQISGFKVTFDSSRPVGSRVLTITLDDGTEVPRDATTYSMATSDFIDAGGDGYTMLAGSTSSVSRDKMADVLLDHIRALGALEPATAGRLVDVAAH